MKFARVIVGSAVVVASSVAASMSGCVSNNPAILNDVDSGGFPAEDTGVPVGADGSPDSTPPADAGPDTTVISPEDAGPEAATVDAADAATPAARIRFGNFTSISLPAADLCVSPHGAGTWQGPLLAGAGLSTGLERALVSAYFSVPAGQYDVRLVPAGAPSCAVDSGAPDITNLPSIPGGASITVAIVDPTRGDAGAGPSVVPLLDEPPSGTAAKLRFVNLASLESDAVSLDLGSGVAAQPLFGSVTPVQMLDPGADSLGYRTTPAVTSIDTTFDDEGSTIVLPGIALPAGSEVTTFVANTNSDGPQYEIIQCIDGPSATATPALSTCVSSFGTSATTRFTRFASFIADTSPPSADICIRYHGLSTFAGPLLGGAADGGTSGAPALTPPPTASKLSPLSGYFQVAGGFDYDVRYVTAGSGNCATGLTADYVYTAPSTGNATLAATGFLNVPGDAGEPTMFDAGPPDSGPDGASSTGLPSVALGWVTLTDENSSEGDLARVVHVGALKPQPFNVTATWTVTDVEYGAFATQGSGAVNADGYFSVTSKGGAFIVTDTIDGGQENELDVQTVDEVQTFFIFTQGTESSSGVGVLQCNDSAFTTGGLWGCTMLNGG